MDACKGLESLHNLVVSSPYKSEVLNIFNTYNSLILLALKLNDKFEYYRDVLCNITSLQHLDVHLSYDSQYLFRQVIYWTCAPPNLKTLNMGYQYVRFTFRGSIFRKAPLLEGLDYSDSELEFEHANYTCSKLEMVLFDDCEFHNYATLNLPMLHTLSLNRLHVSSNIDRILDMFKAPALQNLYLEKNGITVIDVTLFQNFTKLMFLDLGQNKLISISGFVPFINLRTLILHDNAIQIVPKTFLTKSTHPNLTSLYLGQNKFQCDCNVEAFRNWILDDDIVHLESFSQFDYKCFSPDSQKDFSITEVILDCESKLWKYILIGISCVIVVVILVIAVVYYWWHIKYNAFLLFNRRRNQEHQLMEIAERIDDDEHGIPRYDAYVPYHIDDEDWVDGELLPNIEEGEERFRLCLYRHEIFVLEDFFSMKYHFICKEVVKF